MSSFRLLVCTALLLITSAKARANADGVNSNVRHDELNSLDIPNEAPKLKTSLSRQSSTTNYSYILGASGFRVSNSTELLEVGYDCVGASPCTTIIQSVTSVCKWPINETRLGLTAAVASVGGERKIFGCGGHKDKGCYVLDSQNGWEWSLSMPDALDRAVSWAPPAEPTNIYIFGGWIDDTESTVDTVYLLNTTTNSLELTSLKLEDDGMILVGWSDTTAYLFSGFTYEKKVLLFNSTTLTLKEVQKTKFYHAGGCGTKVNYAGKPEIALFGKSSGVPEVEFFDPSNNSVRTGPNPFPETCSECGCIPLGNTLAVAKAAQQLYIFNTSDESWVLHTGGGFSFPIASTTEVPLYDTDLGLGSCPCI